LPFVYLYHFVLFFCPILIRLLDIRWRFSAHSRHPSLAAVKTAPRHLRIALEASEVAGYMAGSDLDTVLASDSDTDIDGDGGYIYDCCAMAKSITETAKTTTRASITAIHTRKSTTTIAFVLLLILCCLCDYNYGSM